MIPLILFSQVDKIGYSKTKLINSMQGQPCKSTINSIWYCGENGSYINYEFNDEIVSSVLYMWEFDDKNKADYDVINETEKNSRVYGKPSMKGDDAFWFVGDFLVSIKYGYTNGKHYSTWSAKRWK
jgi:hypothetical protein